MSKLVLPLKIGHYTLLRFLDRGGMGEVFLATDEVLQRQVAIKILRVDHDRENSAKRARFMREARSIAALNHPNIVVIHEVGTTAELYPDDPAPTPFLVMEYVEGKPLGSLMRARPLGFSEAINIALQVADGLNAAHLKRILHRDIKPSNLMISQEGRVKILDFGISKLLRDGEGDVAEDITQLKETAEGLILGTIRYLSPEQARGQQLDVRSDVFSFGIVLYEMLTGKHPFPGQNTLETVTKIVVEEPTPAVETLGLPEALTRLLQRCLRKDPADRYPSFTELLSDLDAIRRSMLATDELKKRNPLSGYHYAEDSLETLPGGVLGQHSLTNTLTRLAPAPAAGIADMETGEMPPVLPTNEKKRPAATAEIKSGQSLTAPWKFLGAMVLVGLIAGGVIFFLNRSFGKKEEPSAPIFKTTQVTLSSGLDIYPCFSPDKNSIAYTSDRNGSFEIFIKQLLPGGREIQLTNDGQQNFQPAWSPNGDWIAYHSKERGGIWVVPSLGGNPRQVCEFGSRPVWSPDGTMLAFQSDGLIDLSASAAPAQPPSTIWIVTLQGAPPKQITQVGNPAGGHGTPSWSPDGKRISFATYDRRTSAICSITVQGSDLIKVVSTQRYIFDPIYAPDGKHIYYSAVLEDGNYGMWQVSLKPESGNADGEPVQIANLGLGIVRHLALSPDGKKITYSTLSMPSNLWAVSLNPAGTAGDSKPVPLTAETGRNSRPVFSPDGSRIAFEKWRSGSNPDIWVMDSDGNNPIQLTTDPAVETVPSWTPDGRIVFRSNRNGKQSLSAIQPETRKETVLLPIEADTDFPRCSPDGKLFAFNSKKGSSTTNLWIGTLDGKPPQQLTFDQESLGFACWSPDGKNLALQMKRGENTHLVTLPVTGGSPQPVVTDKGQSWPYSWAPDGSRIAFAGLRNEFWNLFTVSTASQETTQVTKFAKLNAYVRYPAWSPTGDRIVFEYAETTGNIWMIELKNN
ncbi:MAG: protein kinase [Blastocatellia bacterium]|nr:protein kinase [Blastocatellia bacterium]